MPKYYVETGTIQIVVNAPDARQAAIKLVEYSDTLQNASLGHSLSVSEAGFTMGMGEFSEDSDHYKYDLLFSIPRLLHDMGRTIIVDGREIDPLCLEENPPFEPETPQDLFGDGCE